MKQAAARGKGRRRSRELEDLHLCASTGRLNLDRLHEADEEATVTSRTPRGAGGSGGKKTFTRRQTDSHLLSKGQGGSIKKTGSKSSLNGTVAGVKK